MASNWTTQLNIKDHDGHDILKNSDDDRDYVIADKRSSFDSLSSPIDDCMFFPGAASEDGEKPLSDHDLQ